jgi:hypothetical protein
MSAETKTQSDGARVRIFRARDAIDPTHTMTAVDTTEHDTKGVASIVDGANVKTIFEDVRSNVSLTYAWFKGNFMLPRHSHNADCLYYVVSGSLHLGTEVLEAGDGFFVPADALYTYRTGADGVEVLEFRTAVQFDIKFRTSEEVWQQITKNADANREAWRAQAQPIAVRRQARVP